MAIVQKKALNWFITGNETLSLPWKFATAGNLGRISNDWTISSLPVGGSQAVGFVDMGLHAPAALAYNQDRLTLTYNVLNSTTYTLSMKGVEYVHAPLNKDISLVSVGPTGFTTDGSLVRIKTGVGNQTLHYESAARDSVVFMGAGRDAVQLNDNPFTDWTQYWALIRLTYGQVDAYNLQTGNRVRLEGGTTTFGNTNRYINYGEIEEIHASNGRTGQRLTFDPGRDLAKDPWGIVNRGLYDNIDLASDDLDSNQQVDAYSDSFNLAYFNFIRYTSNNLYVGQATVHSGNNVSGAYSTPGTQSTNGTHDLVVAEQANALDGNLRLYVRNVQVGLYNEFNAVFLGSAGDDGKDQSGIGTDTPASRVALYGFGGNDVLKGGAGKDYLFGGSSSYSQLVAGATGNQVWGGAGADFFGVGNTNQQGQVEGVGTDVIWDWHAGTDSLRVLSNGTAIIGGLYGVNGLTGNNLVDLRAYAAVATSDADADGSVLSEASDVTVINQGLIVALGRDGADVLRDSPGNDRLYGNAGDNLIDLSAGGSDRVLYDVYGGRQFVRGFDSDAASAGHDQFLVNSRVVDAFGAHRSLAMEARNSTGSYTNAVGYNPGTNYLHDLFYNPRPGTTNADHNNTDGVFNGFGSDLKTFGIGVGFYAAAVAVQFIPFVGPILSVALFSQAVLLGVSSAPTPGFTTQPHQNATYDGVVDSYLTVLNNPTRQPSTVAGVDNVNVNAWQFLDFFGVTNANDGFVPVLEFTRYSGNAGLDRGINGYFAVHSSHETLVYLVTSRDSLVENSEARLVAEINGELWADDFQVYDGQIDIYNSREETPITISMPTIDSVRDGSSQLVQNEGTTTLSTPFSVNVSVDAAVSAGSRARLLDGTTEVSASVAVSGSSFSLTDGRTLGTRLTMAGGTQTSLAEDNTLELNDDRVSYSVELTDGATGIITRNENDYFFTVSGGNVVIDGGDGSDILLLSDTSAFLNNLADAKLVNIESITLAGAAGMVLSLGLQTEGFSVYGTGAEDTITGSRGADVIYGLGGEDDLSGGLGGDTFVVSSSDELAAVGSIDGGGGTDRIRFTAADTAIDDSDFYAVSLVETLELTGASTITSLGTEAQSAGIQSVIAGAGNTSITATLSALAVDAGAMLDDQTLTLAGSTAYSVTTEAADVDARATTGGVDIDASVAAGGITLSGAITLRGGSGSDTIAWDASVGSATIYGGDGADFIDEAGGSAGLRDTLYGGGGNDVIYAGDGNDFLIGGTDADQLHGEGGADLFIFSSGDGTGYRWNLQDLSSPDTDTSFQVGDKFENFDMISDFDPTEGDVIQLPTHLTLNPGDNTVDPGQYEIYYGSVSNGVFTIGSRPGTLLVGNHTLLAYDDSPANTKVGVVVLTGIFIESGWDLDVGSGQVTYYAAGVPA